MEWHLYMMKKILLKTLLTPSSIIWQPVETDFWKKYLKEKLNEFLIETGSKLANKILSNFDNELKKFVQVCPIEMLDKLENPITTKEFKSKSA